MYLLPLIEDADRVLLLDAIDCGRRAGRTWSCSSGERLPRYLGVKLSPHQIDLRDVLALAELRGSLPAKLVAIGVQPARIEMGTGLSPAVDGPHRCRWSRPSSPGCEHWGHPAAAAASGCVDA